MNNYTYNEINFKPAISFLRSRENIVVAYLHGSILTDHFRDDSDIDIAIFLKPGATMNTMELLEITGELSSLLKNEVHIGIVSNKFLIFGKEVVTKGVPLVIKDKNYHDLYVATLLSMYAEQKERQKEILYEYTG